MQQNSRPQPLLSPRQALEQCLAQLRAHTPLQVPGGPPAQPIDSDPQQCRLRLQALCLFERHHAAWYAQAPVPPDSHLPFEVLLLVALAKANLQQKAAARPTPTPPPAPPPTTPPSETVSAQSPSSPSAPSAPASAAALARSAEEPSPLDQPVLPSRSSTVNRPGGPECVLKGDDTQDKNGPLLSLQVSLPPSLLTRPTVPPSIAEVTPLRSLPRGQVPRGRRGLVIEKDTVGTPRPTLYVIDSGLTLTAAWARCEGGPGRGRFTVRPLPRPADASLSVVASTVDALSAAPLLRRELARHRHAGHLLPMAEQRSDGAPSWLSTDVQNKPPTSPRPMDPTRPELRLCAGVSSGATKH